MTRICAALFALFLLTGIAVAGEQVGDSSSLTTDEDDRLEVILVVGVQPGPALWKVTSGDHVMWILGEVSPFPRNVRWQSKRFDKLLRQSQELLLDFSGYWRANEAESELLIRAGKLPPGVTLKDVIPPGLNKQLDATAKKFGAPALQDLRPFAATNQLVSSVMETMDLSGFSARFSAELLGKRRHVRITYFATPEIPFEERIKNWQQPANVACLQRVVERLDDGGRGLRRLMNAWALGDIPKLREYVPKYSFSRDGLRAGECAAAMHGGKQQAEDYKLTRTRLWLEQAERALRDNRSTMAVMPMTELFSVDGYLAGLRAKGYEVEEPQ